MFAGRAVLLRGGVGRADSGAVGAASVLPSKSLAIAAEKPISSNSFSEKSTSPTRPHENAPRHPAAREPLEEHTVLVRHDRERQVILLLPLPARVLALERTYVDDFEAFGPEPLEDAAYDRSLLPASLSLTLPEHDERAVVAGDRQAQIRQR